MSKFSVNYSQLSDQIYKKAYKLSDVKDQLETVAFDVVRFKDGDKSTELWQVQSADDGQQYIVSIYDQEPEQKTASWEVSLTKTASDIQISYKGDPIVRVSSSKLGIPQGEINKVSYYLPSKLAENKKLVKALLNELNESAKEKVLQKYPELA